MNGKIIIGYIRNHIISYDRWGFWRYREGVEPSPESIDTDLTGKKIYVRHIETESLLIVTYINYEPNDKDRAAILEEAKIWLSNQDKA